MEGKRQTRPRQLRLGLETEQSLRSRAAAQRDIPDETERQVVDALADLLIVAAMPSDSVKEVESDEL